MYVASVPKVLGMYLGQIREYVVFAFGSELRTFSGSIEVALWGITIQTTKLLSSLLSLVFLLIIHVIRILH